MDLFILFNVIHLTLNFSYQLVIGLLRSGLKS